MLSADRRIRKDLLPTIWKNGINYHTDAVGLKVYTGPEIGPFSRFAFVVSAKVAKRAHDRNLLKRRGRHIIKKHLAEMQEGAACLLIFKDKAIDQSFSLLESQIIAVLKRAKLIS